MLTPSAAFRSLAALTLAALGAAHTSGCTERPRRAPAPVQEAREAPAPPDPQGLRAPQLLASPRVGVAPARARPAAASFDAVGHPRTPETDAPAPGPVAPGKSRKALDAR